MTRGLGKDTGRTGHADGRAAEGACGGRVSLSSFLFCLFQEAEPGEKEEWGRQAFSSSCNERILHGGGGAGVKVTPHLSCSEGLRR